MPGERYGRLSLFPERMRLILFGKRMTDLGIALAKQSHFILPGPVTTLDRLGIKK
jgi:hypothetical protein